MAVSHQGCATSTRFGVTKFTEPPPWWESVWAFGRETKLSFAKTRSTAEGAK